MSNAKFQKPLSKFTPAFGGYFKLFLDADTAEDMWQASTQTGDWLTNPRRIIDKPRKFKFAITLHARPVVKDICGVPVQTPVSSAREEWVTDRCNFEDLWWLFGEMVAEMMLDADDDIEIIKDQTFAVIRA